MNHPIRWVEITSLNPAMYPVLFSAKNYLLSVSISEIRIKDGI